MFIMMFFALLVGFGLASLATSALAHDPRRWRYAAGLMALFAAILTVWTADLLSLALQNAGQPVPRLITLALAATPYGVVMHNLWIRRRRMPRHTPSVNDDPVLRRYLDEKLRRSRRRRQTEALEGAIDDAG